jgi:hypothetical protein
MGIGNFNMKDPITHISVYEPTDKNTGAEVSFSTNSSRKSFHLPKPSDPKSIRPMAIESFAMDPQTYYEWMNACEEYCKNAKS